MESEYELRWSRFKNMDPVIMHRLFSKEDGVFDFLRNVGNRSAAFSKFMKGATFMIPTPRLLAQVVEMLSNVDMSNRDTKGDLYEFLLSKIAVMHPDYRTFYKILVVNMAKEVEEIIKL